MLIAWEFLTSKVGRYCAVALAVLVAVGAALAKAFSAGKQTERVAEQRKQIDAVEDAHQIHGDVSRLPDDELSRELRKWSH